MAGAGYAETPLVKKLGIKSGQRLAIVKAPDGYAHTLGTLPDGLKAVSPSEAPLDFIQLFTVSRAELESEFPPLRDTLAQAGMLWISWPKRSSGVDTDLSDNVVREVGLAGGLVDVKICAVDETWSGLKFVRRLKDRA